jgi:hypothetical protein
VIYAGQRHELPPPPPPPPPPSQQQQQQAYPQVEQLDADALIAEAEAKVLRECGDTAAAAAADAADEEEAAADARTARRRARERAKCSRRARARYETVAALVAEVKAKRKTWERKLEGKKLET